MTGYAMVTIVGSIFLAGVYAGLETGNYLLNRIRLRFRVSEGDRRGMLLDWTLRDPQLFLCTILVGHNLAVYVASVITTELYSATGRVTAMTWVLGFVPCAFSGYISIQIMGTLLPAVLVIALLADLLLVPAMVQVGWMKIQPPTS